MLTDSRETKSKEIVVIDGPNLVNSAANHLQKKYPEEKERVRCYLSKWFDVDRLIGASTPFSLEMELGTTIFHSRKSVGGKSVGLSTEETDRFWGRQATWPNTSCVLIDIPGEQHETLAGVCPKCEEEVELTSRSEKGIDTGITTYLFETCSRWDTLFLVSQDVDFVPPVQALRRMGKKVFLIGVYGARPSALERTCQSCFKLDLDFVQSDFELFRFNSPDGGLGQIISEVEADSNVQFGIRTWTTYDRGGYPSRQEMYRFMFKDESISQDEQHSILKKRFSPFLPKIEEFESGWNWSTYYNFVEATLNVSGYLHGGPFRHFQQINTESHWDRYLYHSATDFAEAKRKIL